MLQFVLVLLLPLAVSTSPPKADKVVLSTIVDGWAVGMKLEALDRLHPDMIAVATVTNVNGKNVSITFDNWGDGFDYTTDKADADLHPIGFAMYIKHPQKMYKPHNYKGGFSWKKYLLETKSLPVPFAAFTQNQTKGMPKDFYTKMITTDIIQPGS
uniref:Uncharacterized protein n=1 Tax=Plectus sambesii TaxID=2011161 RepID=A0A914VHI6_9BILA